MEESSAKRLLLPASRRPVPGGAVAGDAPLLWCFLQGSSPGAAPLEVLFRLQRRHLTAVPIPVLQHVKMTKEIDVSEISQ